EPGFLQAGGQGVVHVVTRGTGHKPLARKRIPAHRRRVAEAEYAACLRLGTVPHAHVTRLMDAYVDDKGDSSLFFELGLVDVHAVLDCVPKKGTREHTFAREWMLQVAHALGHCHSLGVAHRDLKPENILVFPMHRPGAAATPQGKEPLVAALQQVAAGGAAAKAGTQTLHGYMLKLCDFGSALVAPEGHVGPIKGHSARGSAMYACPQVCALHIGSRRPELAQRFWTPSFLNQMSSDGYDAAAADVWSWGVTVFTLVAGHLPFRTASPDSSTYRAFVLATQPEVVDDALMAPGCSEWQLTHSAMAAGSSRLAASEWSWPAAFSPALRHLLGRCLRVREGERFTMEDIKSHPWFANPRWKPSPVAPLTLPTSPPRLAILAGGPSSSTPTTQTTSGHPTSAASGAGGGMWSAAPSFQGAADRLAAPLSQSNTASTASSHDQ
ncbi:CIPK24, partial [Symbiodinium sp. KB8]